MEFLTKKQESKENKMSENYPLASEAETKQDKEQLRNDKFFRETFAVPIAVGFAVPIIAGIFTLFHFLPRNNSSPAEKLENIEVYEMTGVNNTNKKYFISCDYVRDHTIKESHGPRKYPVYHYEFMSDSTNTTDLITRLKSYKPVRYRKLREEF